MDIRANTHRRPVERRVRPLSTRPLTRMGTAPSQMTPGVAPPTLLEIVSRPAETVAQNSGGGAAHPRVDGRILGGRMNGRTMTAGSSAMRAPAENAGGSGPGTASSNPLPDNAALVAALIRGEPGAWTELVDRFGPDVERLVAGALGVDADLADIVQDVFVRVIERIHQLRDPGALKGWIASVAVFAARGHIRKRRRWRWIRFLAPADIPDVPATTASPENHALVHSTYKLLDTLPDNERMAFSLRFVAEMELTEVAAACGVSLATIKRRLARAEIHFVEGARRDPALNERIERGERWRNK